MAVGLVFGGFWFGLGVLLWWWPAAIFVAFSTEDVTPGARAFAVGALFIGWFFFTLATPALGVRFAVPGTVVTVGALLVLNPVHVLGLSPEGRLTPRDAGVSLLVIGALLAGIVVI